MSAVDSSFSTYDAQANREDLSDIIYNIDPFDTPMITAAGKRKAKDVLFQWQDEELPALDTTTKVEGFELDREAGQPTVRRSNVCQIMERDATVTGTQNAVNPAGKRKEMAHQIALKGKALKREVEASLFGTRQAAVNVDLATARTTRSLVNFLASNSVYNVSDGVNPDQATETQVTDGTQQTFTEDMLNDGIENAWNNGGEPSLGFMGSHQKRIASSFYGRDNSRHQIAANKVVNTVQMYASDFTDIKFIPTRWVRARDVFLMDPRYYKVATLRSFERETMAKIGDADTEMITWEGGLQVDNEKAHVAIRDLSTT